MAIPQTVDYGAYGDLVPVQPQQAVAPGGSTVDFGAYGDLVPGSLEDQIRAAGFTGNSNRMEPADDYGLGGGRGGRSRADRNNNPLNIKSSNRTRAYPGVTGVEGKAAADGGNFLIFDSADSGFAAGRRLLRTKGYLNLNLDKALRRWSNNGYGADEARNAGLDPSRTIASLSDSELNSLIVRMARREGFKGSVPGSAPQPKPKAKEPYGPPAPERNIFEKSLMAVQSAVAAGHGKPAPAQVDPKFLEAIGVRQPAPAPAPKTKAERRNLTQLAQAVQRGEQVGTYAPRGPVFTSREQHFKDTGEYLPDSVGADDPGLNAAAVKEYDMGRLEAAVQDYIWRNRTDYKNQGVNDSANELVRFRLAQAAMNEIRERIGLVGVLNPRYNAWNALLELNTLTNPADEIGFWERSGSLFNTAAELVGIGSLGTKDLVVDPVIELAKRGAGKLSTKAVGKVAKLFDSLTIGGIKPDDAVKTLEKMGVSPSTARSAVDRELARSAPIGPSQVDSIGAKTAVGGDVESAYADLIPAEKNVPAGEKIKRAESGFSPENIDYDKAKILERIYPGDKRLADPFDDDFDENLAKALYRYHYGEDAPGEIWRHLDDLQNTMQEKLEKDLARGVYDEVDESELRPLIRGLRRDARNPRETFYYGKKTKRGNVTIDGRNKVGFALLDGVDGPTAEAIVDYARMMGMSDDRLIATGDWLDYKKGSGVRPKIWALDEIMFKDVFEDEFYKNSSENAHRVLVPSKILREYAQNLSSRIQHAKSEAQRRKLEAAREALGLDENELQWAIRYLLGDGSDEALEAGSHAKPATAHSGSPQSRPDEVVEAVDPRATPFDTPDIVALRKAQGNLPSTHLIDTPERKAKRKELEDKHYGTGAAKKDRQAVIVLGMPGSGKSSVFVKPESKKFGALVIDSDLVKEDLPEFGGGKFAGAVHVESSDIADNVFGRAVEAGDNVVYPLVGKNPNRIREVRDLLKEAGYDVHIRFVKLPPEKAAPRVVTRFEETGRFVDPAYVIHDVKDGPEKTYAIIKDEGGLASYEAYDNDVPFGEPPKLIERSSDRPEPASGRRPAGRESDQGSAPIGKPNQSAKSEVTAEPAVPAVSAATTGRTLRRGRKTYKFVDDAEAAAYDSLNAKAKSDARELKAKREKAATDYDRDQVDHEIAVAKFEAQEEIEAFFRRKDIYGRGDSTHAMRAAAGQEPDLDSRFANAIFDPVDALDAANRPVSGGGGSKQAGKAFVGPIEGVVDLIGQMFRSLKNTDIGRWIAARSEGVRDTVLHFAGDSFAKLKALGPAGVRVAEGLTKQLSRAESLTANYSVRLHDAIKANYGFGTRTFSKAWRKTDKTLADRAILEFKLTGARRAADEKGTAEALAHVDELEAELKALGGKLTKPERAIWKVWTTINQELSELGQESGVMVRQEVGKTNSAVLKDERIRFFDPARSGDVWGTIVGMGDGFVKVSLDDGAETTLKEGERFFRRQLVDPAAYFPRVIKREAWEWLKQPNSPEYAEAVKHLEQTGQARDTAAAKAALADVFGTDVVPTAGPVRLERPRLGVELPAKFYEKDFFAVAKSHIEEAAMRIAHAEQWGSRGEKLWKELHELGKDAEGVPQAIEHAIGRGSEGKLAGKGARLAAAEASFTALTKLTGGTTGVVQLSQLASTFGVLGGKAAGLAFVDAGKAIFSKEGRRLFKEIKLSGAVDNDLLSLIGMDDLPDLLGKSANFALTITGMKPIDKALRYHAAAAGLVATKDAIAKLATGKGGRIREDAAYRFLKDWAGFSEKDIDRFVKTRKLETADKLMAFAAGVKTNIRTRAADLPEFAATPIGKMVMRLKTFQYGQAKVFGHTILEAKKGNFTPLLRLLAGGAIMGEAIRRGRGAIVGGAEGDLSRYEEDTAVFDEAIESAKAGDVGAVLERAYGNVLQAGVLGMYDTVPRTEEMVKLYPDWKTREELLAQETLSPSIGFVWTALATWAEEADDEETFIEHLQDAGVQLGFKEIPLMKRIFKRVHGERPQTN